MLFLKALIGAAIVVLISILSKNKLYYLSGLVPLFPSFALMAHIINFTDGHVAAVRESAIFGLLALIPYAVYLLVVIFTIYRFNFYLSIAFAVLAWIIVALLLILLWNNFIKV